MSASRCLCISDFMRCSSTWKHSLICHARTPVLLEEIIDRLAQQMLQRYVKFHCQHPKLFAHRHRYMHRQLYASYP